MRRCDASRIDRRTDRCSNRSSNLGADRLDRKSEHHSGSFHALCGTGVICPDSSARVVVSVCRPNNVCAIPSPSIVCTDVDTDKPADISNTFGLTRKLDPVNWVAGIFNPNGGSDCHANDERAVIIAGQLSPVCTSLSIARKLDAVCGAGIFGANSSSIRCAGNKGAVLVARELDPNLSPVDLSGKLGPNRLACFLRPDHHSNRCTSTQPSIAFPNSRTRNCGPDSFPGVSV